MATPVGSSVGKEGTIPDVAAWLEEVQDLSPSSYHACLRGARERERMPLSVDRRRSFARRLCCFPLILLCQLAWILPSTFFFLIQTSAPRVLILRDNNISRSGFAGPVKILYDRDLATVREIDAEWSSFWPGMKEKLLAHGFVEPPARTCFVWLPKCHMLARNERILQIVTDAIGSKVLLYGITVWRGADKVAQRFHIDPEPAGCDKSLNFVTGTTSIQLISRSHNIPGRLLQSVLRSLEAIEEESVSITSEAEQIAYLERSFARRGKRMARTAELSLESLQIHGGYGVFFHGSTIYRLGEVPSQGRALLLQYISADCKVRDSRNFAWGSQGMQHSVYMPPVLLVAGNHMELGASNDVRLNMVEESAVGLKISHGEHGVLGGKAEDKNFRMTDVSPIHNLTVFSEFNASAAWGDMGIWRFKGIGQASTEVMARSRIDYFLLKDKLPAMKFGRVMDEGELLIVVQQEGMLYFRGVSDDELSFCELLELKPGSAVLFSKRLLHALVPLGMRTSFVSFRWLGYSNIGKKFADDKLLGFDSMEATEGRSVTLASGQAYDPDNDENCDVIVFVVEGYLLQILPLNSTLQAPDVLLIPAGKSCVLWNVSGLSVKFFVMHLCHLSSRAVISTSYGGSGKIF